MCVELPAKVRKSAAQDQQHGACHSCHHLEKASARGEKLKLILLPKNRRENARNGDFRREEIAR